MASLLLDYAGPRRDHGAPRTLIGKLPRAVGVATVSVVFIAFLIVRYAVLVAGFACVFAGTLLLMLGGKRSAARHLGRWRERATDLLQLWSADLARPVRRWWGGRAPHFPAPLAGRAPDPHESSVTPGACESPR
jgi:hypothetical protein